MSYNYNTEPKGGFGIYDGRRCGCGSENGEIKLAIATVPMQIWRKTYSPDKALCAGTMFAELDLPFMGGKCK